jgi:MoxR-like ATPase
VDRFALKVRLDYESHENERAMLKNTALEGRDAWKLVTPVITVKQLLSLRKQIQEGVFVSDAVTDYIVALCRATRPGKPEFAAVVAKQVADGIAADERLDALVKLGCSPRAEQVLLKLTRVRAACLGRDYVLPEDVTALAHEVLRHRISLSDEANFDGRSSDEVVDVLLASVDVVEDADAFTRK